MSCAPQEWLADFGPLTNIIRKGNGEMDIDEMSADLEQGAVNEAVNRIFAEAQKTELEDGESFRVCEDCGESFAGKGKSRYCRACAKERRRQGIMEYIERGKKRADESKIQNPDERRMDKEAATAPVETVFVKKASPFPVLEAERERKKQPIEAHFGPYKAAAPENDVCSSNFPSLSNKMEHPEHFADPTDQSAVQQEPDDETVEKAADFAEERMKRAFKADRRGALYALYNTLSDACAYMGMPVSELLDRMRRIDEALS